MKSYQEIMIEKYADELEDVLHGDLNNTCKTLTKIFRGLTIGDSLGLLDELEENGMDLSSLRDCFNAINNTILKGTKPGSDDAHTRITSIMEKLHYDNGLPLTGYNYPEKHPTEWHDYFEHYDRDQDFWGFYWDVEIYSFVTDGKDIFIKLDLSLSDLRYYLTNSYDGADWHHDFRGAIDYDDDYEDEYEEE